MSGSAGRASVAFLIETSLGQGIDTPALPQASHESHDRTSVATGDIVPRPC